MEYSDFKVRDALLEDAADATFVLRESMCQLCHVDHKNDSGQASGWLVNKTPQLCCHFTSYVFGGLLAKGTRTMVVKQ
ncbi:hypothetical protein PsAD26_01143 [Pseudovibrio sp. Ad26]|nr:hypothetical protein PsAD26_01143 [Pseudovibrio sp. Ad26]